MNESVLDRVIRSIVGIVLLLVAFLAVTGAWQIVLWILGGILVLTAAIGICPLYLLFRISTKK